MIQWDLARRNYLNAGVKLECVILNEMLILDSAHYSLECTVVSIWWRNENSEIEISRAKNKIILNKNIKYFSHIEERYYCCSTRRYVWNECDMYASAASNIFHMHQILETFFCFVFVADQNFVCNSEWNGLFFKRKKKTEKYKLFLCLHWMKMHGVENCFFFSVNLIDVYSTILTHFHLVVFTFQLCL